ncbi:hypothetical protein WBG78_24605 [Chryseolinea sp. T2]|uniref:hypothetical protein n=1 Tax=Chryseolinea sp. T2 TaxID=3129255 RepID=UPI0030779CC3
MDSSRLQQLLQKYWEGETTLEEEQLLKDYFQSNEVSDELRDVASMFQYFNQAKKNNLNDITFDRTLMDKVSAKPREGRARNLIFNSMRIAAGVVVVIAATWFIRKEIRQSTPQEVIDTYDDPKLAFEETKKALMMISKSFGTAQEQAKKINLFNEAQEEIQKTPTNN